MTDAQHFDVVIIGGGTMGTAAAWALARQGAKAVVLEQFQHVHSLGSHGGDTRVIRHVYAESPEYVPVVQRADTLWQELEAETGKQVLVRCGGLELAAPGFQHTRAARASADEHGLAYEWLSPAEARDRWPAFHVPDDWDALYSPDSGFLLTKPALHGMAERARSLGATIVPNTAVTDLRIEPQGIRVDTSQGAFTADSAVITAGAWAPRLLADLHLPLHVRRKTLWWQGVDEPERYQPDRFPVFVADSDAGEIYGFPVFGSPGLKIANHQGGETVNPDTVNRETRPGENRACLELANRVLPGVLPGVVKSAVCLYTMTPDADFIVDRHPGDHRVAIGAGFSGHGFKFAPAIGEMLAQLILDTSANPMSRFAISRFNGQ